MNKEQVAKVIEKHRNTGLGHCRCGFKPERGLSELQAHARHVADEILKLPEPQSESVLQEAERLINGDRQEAYSHPYVNFGDTAQLFSAYLERDVTSLDVANLMILVKLARAKRRYKRDNYTDIAGYAGCAEKVEDRSRTLHRTTS